MKRKPRAAAILTSRPERKVLNMANAENAAPRRSPARMAGTLGRVLGYMLRQYKGSCLAVALCIVGSALASVQGVLFTQQLIDSYIAPLAQSASPDFGPLALALVRVAVVYAFSVACSFGYNRIMCSARRWARCSRLAGTAG